MEITLKYAATRKEVWDWYWRAWRRGLWKIHVVVFLLILYSVGSRDGHWPIADYRFVLDGFLIATAVIIAFVSFPQLMYKPQTRSLTINEDGIRTVIGPRSGKVKWAEVADIETRGEHIVITGRWGNSFLIPSRAFESDGHRDSCSATMFSWWQNNAQDIHKSL